MSSPGLALTDNNSGHDLLTELRFSLLDGGHDHVTDTGSGETVQTRTNALDRDDVQVTSTGVVAAVEDGATIGRRVLARFFFFFRFRRLCVMDCVSIVDLWASFGVQGNKGRF